jgi:hypothetical protein
MYPGRHGIFDWLKDIYFLHFFHGAVADYHTIPLSFLWFPRAIAEYPSAYTVSYWANPEVPTFSPLAVLSLFLPTLAAFKVVIALHLSAGALGIGLVSRRAGLGPGGTLGLLLCTLLNPWLAQHVAIGYTSWISACLVPLIVALLSGRPTVAALAGASALDALILYQGGLHVFLWFNAALACVAVFMAVLDRDLGPLRRPGLLLALTGVLALPKLWAVAAAFRGIERMMAHSYASIADLWGLLTDARSDPFKFPEAANMHGTAIYDASTVMGTWFLVLVALALLLLAFRAWRSRGRAVPGLSLHIGLVATAALCVALGWQGVWAAAVRVVPTLNAQIHPHRFLFVAVFLLAVFIVLEIDRLARRLPGWWKEITMVLVFLPVLVVLGPRNRFMAETAAARPDALSSFSLKGVLSQVITATREDGTPLPVSASPSGARIDLDGYSEPILLPWLSTKAQRENFQVVGAVVEEKGDAVAPLRLVPQRGAVVVELRAKEYGRLPLVGVGLALWLAILLLWGRTIPRPRPVSAPPR